MMNRTIILIALAFTLVGCQKASVFSREPGKAVVFTTNTQNQPATKTVYDSGTGKGTIYWVQDDEVGIYCAQATAPDGSNFASYVLRPEEGSNAFKATLDIAGGGNGLTWGTGSHTFYCLYPSPTWASAPTGTALSGNTVTTVIPAAQTGTPSEVTAGGVKTTTFAPDMRYASMIASTVAASGGEGGAVTLDFKAHFTAFEFIIQADDSADLDLTTFKLSSTSNVLAATATATISGTGTDVTAATTSTTNENNTITFTLGTNETPFILEKSEPGSSHYVILTVLALAKENITNVTLRFNTVSGYRSLALKYADDYFAAHRTALIDEGKANADGYLIFPAGKKISMAGFSVPGILLVTFSDIVIGGQYLADAAPDWKWMLDLDKVLIDPISALQPYGSEDPGTTWRWVLYDMDLEEFVVNGQYITDANTTGAGWKPLLNNVSTGTFTNGGQPYADDNNPGSDWTISH